MLPFTNRLRNAQLVWATERIHLTPQPDQHHALHGVGHRRSWEVVQTSSHSLTLSLKHDQPDADWPWRFVAEMSYTLTPDGLEVCITLKNTSTVDMPAAIGWHPFLPLITNTITTYGNINVSARQSHDIGPEGLSRAFLSATNSVVRKFSLSTCIPQTTAYEGWDGQLFIAADATRMVCVSSSNASCLVLHVPNGRRYICAEPVSVLPGAFENYSDIQKRAYVALAPGAKREITCSIGVVARP